MGSRRNRGAGQGTPEEGPAAALPTGRVERAVAGSIRAGREAAANPLLAGTETLARELARGIDIAAAKADPYALAQLGPKLLDVLTTLQLVPQQQKSSSDALADAVAAALRPE